MEIALCSRMKTMIVDGDIAAAVSDTTAVSDNVVPVISRRGRGSFRHPRRAQ
jgi:hypothetical protein